MKFLYIYISKALDRKSSRKTKANLNVNSNSNTQTNHNNQFMRTRIYINISEMFQKDKAIGAINSSDNRAI